MRAFLAINLDMKIISELAQIQEELKIRVRGIRWVKPKLLHITLKFLGEITMEDIELLEQPLRRLGSQIPSFKISFSSLGAFPHQRHPRIIWMGVDEGARELRRLSLEIEKLLKVHKIISKPDKSKFMPHLTIGRRSKHEELYLSEGIFDEQWVCKNILNVKEFCLMQSTLYSSGPVYTSLKKFFLKKI